MHHYALSQVRAFRTVRPLSPSLRAQQRNVSMAAEPFTIIGGGRVGNAIKDMGDGSDVLVLRGDPILGPEGPIVVCTRNDDLADIVKKTPAERRKDLVFIQNGMLQPWLATQRLEDCTQALIYFAVAKMGDAPTDGITDTNPEGLTAAWGPHAEALAARLKSGGLSCKVLNTEEFQKSMLEKLIWICAFMLVGAKHPGATVGDVESTYRDEVAALIGELTEAGEVALGVKLDGNLVERLCAFSRTVAHFPTAVKEFSWRNGWFYDLSTAALESGDVDLSPLHTQWLKDVGAV